MKIFVQAVMVMFVSIPGLGQSAQWDLTDPLALEASGENAEIPTAQAQASSDSLRTQESVYDKIWKFAGLYRNEENRVVQNILFTGRLQYDYSAIDAGQESQTEWNLRRLRVGARSKLYRTFTLHGEVELNPQEGDPTYVRITDMYLQWARSGALELTLGKHSAPFTIDGATSSKELLAIDRSNLTNNIWFPQEYFPGVSITGEVSPWTYHIGLYSAGAANREFGEFNGSVFSLISIGYDFGASLGVNEALLSANYMYQNTNPNNTFTRRLQNTVSLNLNLGLDKWGLRADVAGASGYLGQSDLGGFMAMPFVNITDKLQLVGRYTLIASEHPNGIQLATYENRVTSGRGNEYNELYLGANYYFYSHKLKLQSGVQFADMQDRANDSGAYSGFSWTSGLRVSW
jgi:phosphate-selective porin OprO/OprP